MIFQRCTQKCEYDFRIGNGVIYVMQNYTYLGTPITSHLAEILHFRLTTLDKKLFMRSLAKTAHEFERS